MIVKIVTLCLLGMMMFSSLTIATADQFKLSSTHPATAPTTSFNLTRLPQDNFDPVIYGNNMYFIADKGSHAVYVEVSHDSGASFRATRLDNGTGSESGPRVAVSQNGTLYALWTQKLGRTFYLVSRVSFDNGRTFGSQVVISNGKNEEITASGSNVHIGFVFSKGGVIGLAVSHDYGLSYSVSTVSNSSYHSQEVDIASLKNHVYMVWETTIGTTRNIAFLYSSDNGTTLKTKIINAPLKSSREPIIAVSSNGIIYVTWRAKYPSDIYLVKSSDNGTTFSKNPINISNDPGDSREPWVASQGSSVYISWRDNTNSSYYNTYVAVSSDNGTNLAPQRLGGDSGITSVNGGNFSPEVAAALSGTVGVIWSAVNGTNQQAFVAISYNSGKSFSIVQVDNARSVSNTLASSSPLTSNTAVCFSWVDRNSTGIKARLYCPS